MKYAYKKSKNRIKSGGFTLIEMLVSVALFATVMVIATGAIFTIINGNKKAQAINTVVNNLNFSIESMVRDMKTGFQYTCGANTSGLTLGQMGQASSDNTCAAATPTGVVSFFSTLKPQTAPVEYRFIPNNGSTPGTIQRTDLALSSTYNLTSQDIDITKVQFYISSCLTTNCTTKTQPSIFLIIEGTAKISDSQVSNFHIQTFVSQRLLNI